MVQLLTTDFRYLLHRWTRDCLHRKGGYNSVWNILLMLIGPAGRAWRHHEESRSRNRWNGCKEPEDYRDRYRYVLIVMSLVGSNEF
jgi:hypothetical protein